MSHLVYVSLIHSIVYIHPPWNTQGYPALKQALTGACCSYIVDAAFLSEEDACLLEFDLMQQSSLRAVCVTAPAGSHAAARLTPDGRCVSVSEGDLSTSTHDLSRDQARMPPPPVSAHRCAVLRRRIDVAGVGMVLVCRMITQWRVP